MRKLLQVLSCIYILAINVVAQSGPRLEIRLGSKNLQLLMEKRLPPVELVNEVWRQLPVSEKPASVHIKTAWYTSNPGEFVVAYLITTRTSDDDLRSMSGFWVFGCQNGRVVRIGGAASKSIDRIDVEGTAWCNWEAAYHSVSDPKITRQVYGQLQQLVTQPDLIQLHPTKSRLAGALFARDEERNTTELLQLIRQWKSTPPAFVGITQSPYDVLLWCDDGLSLWCFEWRKDSRGWTLADWKQFDHPDMPRAKARLCTISTASIISLSKQQGIGGAGTTVTLAQLGQSSAGQLLTRFIRLGALNNQNEIFGYFDQSIDRPTRLAWWPMFQQAAGRANINAISVITLPNGQLSMSYPAINGSQMIRCSLPSPNRLIVLGVNATPKIVSNLATIDKSLIENRHAIKCLEYYIQRSHSGKLGELARGGFESPVLFNQWAGMHRAFQCISKRPVSVSDSSIGSVGSYELVFISKTSTGYALGHCFYEPNNDSAIQGQICLFKVLYFSSLDAVMSAYRKS